MLPCPCVTFILASVANLFTSHLGNDSNCWRTRLTHVHRKAYPFHLIIQILLCWVHSLESIFIEHKYLHMPYPFEEICQPFLPDLFVTDFSITFLSNLLTFQPSVSHDPWISIDLYFYISLLPSKMDNQVQCSKFCVCRGFPFTLVLQHHLRVGILCILCPFWS